MQIPVYSSYIRRKDMDTVLDCLVTDSIEPGDYLGRFIKYSREIIGFEAAIAFRSPITALKTVFDCLGLKPGDRIALSALSPIYYLIAIEEKGLETVWLDVNEDTAMPEPSILESCGAKACVMYEANGLPLAVDILESIKIPLIEDISCSFGSVIDDRKAGNDGIFTLLSLEGHGILTAGGGALLWASQKRDAVVLKNAYEKVPVEYILGDMNSALVLSQLREFEKGRLKRMEMDNCFTQSLGRTKYKSFPVPENAERAHYGFHVILSGGVKDIRAYAKKKNIETELTFKNSCVAAGLLPEGSCPVANSLVNRCITFPLHVRIGKNDVQKITRVLATLP